MSSSRSGLSNMQDILELAKLLRKNGDKVLNGTSKLALSTKLLQNLNDAFSLIIDDSKDFESSFQVCNSSEIELFRDLKFLHDFVQKTIWLKVSYIPSDPKTSIDISKFRHLRFLELQKVCIDLVNGIQGVRGQLESITCTGAGGVGTIGRLLAACGGDAGVGFVWASLNRLVLSYNGLGRLDKSLELAPWLQTLDLSHNFISVAGEIDCLPSLKFVNLAFNRLESVPIFNRTAYRTLRILMLKNNYIEQLDGLQNLDCLTELDLSYNCLSDHSVLWPLRAMTSLSWISLEGNPISYHKRHRIVTMKYLHSSLAESKFVLDKSPLSKSEKLLVSENRLFTIISEPSPIRDDLPSSLSGSMNSEITTVSIETPAQSELVTTHVDVEIVKNVEKSYFTKLKKKQNVQEAVIADDDIETDYEKMSSSILSNSYFETSTDHLETKKKMLALREKFGNDNWLSSHAGSFVQEIMGIERAAGPVLKSTPSMEASSFVQADTIHFPTAVENWNLQSSSNVEENPVEESIEEELDERIDESENPLKPEEINLKQITDTEAPYDPEEENGELFLVQKKRNEDDEMEELFLIITPEDIKERDSTTRKIKNRWSIDTVLSCVMGRGEVMTIDFIFDTARRDRQNRTYFVEPEDASKIVKTVGDSMKTRPILLKVFKCMKCSTHFSQDPDYFLGVTSGSTSNMKSPMCPSCNSTLVIQTDELLTPDEESTKNSESKNSQNLLNLDKSESLINTSENQTDLHHSPSHSSIGSATSLDESRESTPSASTLAKKYESDIEVLSNPSQSSIEVLDDGTKSTSTPKRKRSSEERRIAVAPSLLTIPDTALVVTGLTESSSSGSLTDSVCTAYENKNSKISGGSSKIQPAKITDEVEQNLSVGMEKENAYAPVANLTSMLGGLLQSMKIGTTKGSSAKLDNSTEFVSSNIQYSYTDFVSVDHRIKLHLILNVFEQENEELILFLRAEILMQNQLKTFPGCLVLSTSKIYILRMIGPESEDPQRWLQKEISWTTDRLRTFAPLPFKQGVLVELEQPNKISDELLNFTLLCILQDFQRTSNLLFYLTDLSLPTSCEVEFSIPEQCTTSIHGLMSSSKYHRDGDSVRILALFSSVALKLENHEIKLKIGGLVVTTSSLILTEDKIHWLLPESNEKPVKLTEQAISNLIEVIIDECTLGLSFLDEVAGIEEIWNVNFVSSGAAQAVIHAIQPPWEELFSVPLQITTKTLTQSEINQKS